MRLKVSKSSKNVNDTEAINLDIEQVGFSEPKMNKDNKWNSLVLNTKNNTVIWKNYWFISSLYLRCFYV